MRYRNEILVVLAAILAAMTPVSGQSAAGDPAAKKTLMDAANALGMVRVVARSLDVVNMLEYTASGIKAAADGGGAYKVGRITAGHDYVIPAARGAARTLRLH